MAGDSHVASKIYPEAVFEVISKSQTDIEFNYFGHIGAGFYTFNEEKADMDTILSSNPDILIVHLGTNDSYTPNFDPTVFCNNLTIFYDTIHNSFPECLIVFVTPFINKFKNGKVNEETVVCANALLDFSKSHPGTFVIDNNREVAMRFLNDPSLIKKDNVHLTPEGYKILGEMIGKDLLSIPQLWDIFESSQETTE